MFVLVNTITNLPFYVGVTIKSITPRTRNANVQQLKPIHKIPQRIFKKISDQDIPFEYKAIKTEYSFDKTQLKKEFDHHQAIQILLLDKYTNLFNSVNQNYLIKKFRSRNSFYSSEQIVDLIKYDLQQLKTNNLNI